MLNAVSNVEWLGMEKDNRVFPLQDFIRPTNASDPIRSVVLETAEAIIVVWHVQATQEIAAHVHPHGQDTWTVISGQAEYYQGGGSTRLVKANEIVVARPNQVHGAKTIGNMPFVFVSVVAPGNAGYQLVENNNYAAF
jgi:quercetin dioxygenase-like cupin family protein